MSKQFTITLSEQDLTNAAKIAQWLNTVNSEIDLTCTWDLQDVVQVAICTRLEQWQETVTRLWAGNDGEAAGQ